MSQILQIGTTSGSRPLVVNLMDGIIQQKEKIPFFQITFTLLLLDLVFKSFVSIKSLYFPCLSIELSVI